MNKTDFPIFTQKINGKPLVYLDSAATSQKPKQVIDAIVHYYEVFNANVRRGLYPLSEKATAKVEEVRAKVARFINAKDPSEIIFVRNATEAINLVASSFASHNIKRGDRVVTTIMEHHSNFVPWQQVALQRGAKFEVLDIDNKYHLSFKIYDLRKTRVLALTHVSNVLGTINSIRSIIKEFRKSSIIDNKSSIVLVDGAQSVPHMRVDVQELDADFLAFSGHKMLAATGIGVLYGKRKLLDRMQPFLFGGEMIREVRVDGTTFADPPHKFEAGTPDIAGIISLGAAIDYIEGVGIDIVQKHEQELVAYCLSLLAKIDGITIYGPKDPKQRGGVVAFNLNGVHAHDVAQVLGDMGICIRSGHHCAMPLHKRLGVPATARASFYLYNDESNVDKLIEGIQKVKRVFRV